MLLLLLLLAVRHGGISLLLASDRACQLRHLRRLRHSEGLPRRRAPMPQQHAHQAAKISRLQR